MSTAVATPAATATTAPADQPADSTPRWRSIGRVTVRVAGTVVMAFAVLALLAMTVGPRVLHYRTATMLTGSMVPTINPGDVIVDVQEPATQLTVGQIVTYQIPVDDHRVESHRVIWVGRDKAGAVLFRTQGDANNGADPWTAKAADTNVWRVRGVVPLAGQVIRFLRQPLAQMLLTRLLPLAVVVFALFSIWRPRRPGETE
jgi:signal peptidase